MKQSHLTAPRQMRDATFCAWGDPVERHERSYRAGDLIVACLLVFFCALVAVGVA